MCNKSSTLNTDIIYWFELLIKQLRYLISAKTEKLIYTFKHKSIAKALDIIKIDINTLVGLMNKNDFPQINTIIDEYNLILVIMKNSSIYITQEDKMNVINYLLNKNPNINITEELSEAPTAPATTANVVTVPSIAP